MSFSKYSPYFIDPPGTACPEGFDSLYMSLVDCRFKVAVIPGGFWPIRTVICCGVNFLGPDGTRIIPGNSSFLPAYDPELPLQTHREVLLPALLLNQPPGGISSIQAGFVL
jgi:hypothetical protein